MAHDFIREHIDTITEAEGLGYVADGCWRMTSQEWRRETRHGNRLRVLMAISLRADAKDARRYINAMTVEPARQRVGLWTHAS